LLTGSVELELKVPSLRGDGFIRTSRAEAREALDVHAVEFSKTRPAGPPRKRPPLARETLGKK
jgi:hypothetical protein